MYTIMFCTQLYLKKPNPIMVYIHNHHVGLSGLKHTWRGTSYQF